MFGSTKKLWRHLLLLACAALLLTWSSGLLRADRDSATCVQTCNAVKELCRDACRVDCQALFGNDTPESSACISACQQGCSADSQECKAKCNVKKNPPHNGEP